MTTALTTRRTEIASNVYLTVEESGSFRTGVVSAHFVRALAPGHTAAVLVPAMLLRGTVKHPGMLDLRREMESLYGARVVPSVRKKGETHCVGLVCDFPRGRYVGDTLQDARVPMLVSEILLDPLFSPEGVAIERDKLAGMIRAEVNDRQSYSEQRLLSHMCRGEAMALARLGTESEAAALDAATVEAAYRELLENARLEIFVSGVSATDCFLRFAPRRAVLPELSQAKPAPPDGPKPVLEHVSGAQSRVAAGWRWNIKTTAPEFPAALLANTIFGGYSGSMLFKRLREELSLCYEVYSRFDRYKGLLIAAAGTPEPEHALSEIMACQKMICNGAFSETELEGARAVLRAQLLALTDDPASIEEYSLGQAITGSSQDPAALCAAVSRTSGAEVAEAMRAACPDTALRLKVKG